MKINVQDRKILERLLSNMSSGECFKQSEDSVVIFMKTDIIHEDEIVCVNIKNGHIHHFDDDDQLWVVAMDATVEVTYAKE